jgi:hypothetical protein
VRIRGDGRGIEIIFDDLCPLGLILTGAGKTYEILLTTGLW